MKYNFELFNRYTFNSESGGVDVDPEPITLLGHKKKINSIYLSHAFGIAVSASEDENIIIWDLNELMYIRCTPSDNLPVINCIRLIGEAMFN